MIAAALTRALLGVGEARVTFGSGAASGADVLQLTTVELTFGAVVFAVWGGPSALAHVPDFDRQDWAVVAYLCLACTLLAFLGQLWATKHTSASLAGILLGTEPGWALLVGTVLAGTAIGPVALIGAVTLMLAVLWGGRAERRWRSGRLAAATGRGA